MKQYRALPFPIVLDSPSLWKLTLEYAGLAVLMWMHHESAFGCYVLLQTKQVDISTISEYKRGRKPYKNPI